MLWYPKSKTIYSLLWQYQCNINSPVEGKCPGHFVVTVRPCVAWSKGVSVYACLFGQHHSQLAWLRTGRARKGKGSSHSESAAASQCPSQPGIPSGWPPWTTASPYIPSRSRPRMTQSENTQVQTECSLTIFDRSPKNLMINKETIETFCKSFAHIPDLSKHPVIRHRNITFSLMQWTLCSVYKQSYTEK